MRQFMQAIGITFFAWAFTAMGMPIDSQWRIVICGGLFAASLPFYVLAWTVKDREQVPERGTIHLKGDHPADSIADQVRRRQWPMA